MKSHIRILTILLVLIISQVMITKQASAQRYYANYQLFYDQLSPYGEWVDYPNFGYVWIPNAGYDFVPYSTRGHWILSNYGWTWVSDYNWGWAPFHYGRWDYDNYYGWFWIPDNEWGPAWVTWRRSEGYYGWSPMEPGISLSVSFGRGYDSRNDHWIFVRDRDIDRSNINRYTLNRADHDRVIRNSTVINNTYVDNSRNTTYVTGPDRGDFQKVAGRKVNTVTIEEYDRPGQVVRSGQMRIYKPQVSRNNDNEQRPAPARIVDLKDVNRPSERVVINRSRNTNPPDNYNRDRQTNTVNRRDNNNVNSVQTKETTTPNSDKRGQQTNTVNQQNNNGDKNLQQQNADQSRNSRRVQNENAARPLKNSKSEQPGKSKSEDNKKKKD
jgi:hypothetical protein